MTKTQWLRSKNIRSMLKSLDGKVTMRQLRLFACACLRNIWSLIGSDVCRSTVEKAEAFADGLLSETELAAARLATTEVVRKDFAERRTELSDPYIRRRSPSENVRLVRLAVWSCALLDPLKHCNDLSQWGEDIARKAARGTTSETSEHACQLTFLRDIFDGNALQIQLQLNRQRGNTGAILSVAQSIYDNRSYDEMPVLADALEDAGCTNEMILNHCRKEQNHVRGCWVLDLIRLSSDLYGARF